MIKKLEAGFSRFFKKSSTFRKLYTHIQKQFLNQIQVKHTHIFTSNYK